MSHATKPCCHHQPHQATRAESVAPSPAGGAYTCPMHPEVIRDKPGDCPICGMALEPLVPTNADGPSDEKRDRKRRFLWSALLAALVVALAMADMIPGLELDHRVSWVASSRDANLPAPSLIDDTRPVLSTASLASLVSSSFPFNAQLQGAHLMTSLLRFLPFVMGSSLCLATALPESATAADPPELPGKDAGMKVSVPLFANPTCPIMGKPISNKLFVDTTRGRIYVCCKGCNKKVLNDVDMAYKTAFPTTKKVGNKACPVTGKPIGPESPTVVIQGYEVSVCSRDCVARAAAESPLVLARAVNPKVRDIGNQVCPITGQAVERNVFCLIGDDLVRLSAAECVEEVRKDPMHALTRARELAARGAKAAQGK